MTMFVKPNRGRLVPMPNYHGLPETALPPNGAYVPEEGYWFRRLGAREVERIPARPTEWNKDGTYVYTQGHWWFRRRHDGKAPSPESPDETGTCLPEGGDWFRRLDDDEVSRTLTAPKAFFQRQRGEAFIYRENRGFERLPVGTSLLPVPDRAEVTYVHKGGVWYQPCPLDKDSDEDQPDDSASAGEGPSVPLPEPHEEPEEAPEEDPEEAPEEAPEEDPEEEMPAGNIRLTPHMPPSEETP